MVSDEFSFTEAGNGHTTAGKHMGHRGREAGGAGASFLAEAPALILGGDVTEAPTAREALECWGEAGGPLQWAVMEGGEGKIQEVFTTPPRPHSPPPAMCEVCRAEQIELPDSSI